jgi:hypothetical protein
MPNPYIRAARNAPKNWKIRPRINRITTVNRNFSIGFNPESSALLPGGLKWFSIDYMADPPAYFCTFTADLMHKESDLNR